VSWFDGRPDNTIIRKPKALPPVLLQMFHLKLRQSDHPYEGSVIWVAFGKSKGMSSSFLQWSYFSTYKYEVLLPAHAFTGPSLISLCLYLDLLRIFHESIASCPSIIVLGSGLSQPLSKAIVVYRHLPSLAALLNLFSYTSLNVRASLQIPVCIFVILSSRRSSLSNGYLGHHARAGSS